MELPGFDETGSVKCRHSVSSPEQANILLQSFVSPVVTQVGQYSPLGMMFSAGTARNSARGVSSWVHQTTPNPFPRDIS